MKKILIILGILIILSFIVLQLQQFVSAVTLGIEPPANFMNALRSCTVGKYKDTNNKSMISEYYIKGILPNGRCEFTRTSYTDFSNKETYETAKRILGDFAEMAESMAKEQSQKFEKPTGFPSQEEMIKMTQEEKDIMTCKLSKNEINMLYEAWQKHDDKNAPAKVTDNEISFSWSSSKMSSFDGLMMRFSSGPCTSSNDATGSTNAISKKYACEYADTTCYITILTYNDGTEGATMTCTYEPEGVNHSRISKVKEHAKSGLCEELLF